MKSPLTPTSPVYSTFKNKELKSHGSPKSVRRNDMRANWNNIAIAIVFVLVIVVFYKLASYPRVRPLEKMASKNKDSSWSEKHFPKETDIPLEKKEKSSDETSMLKAKLIQAEAKISELKTLLYRNERSVQEKEMKKAVKGFAGHKLVHLDLKGAPPKMPYLLQLLPLFKKWGATGVLVEYEDMFPYHGELKILQTSFGYSNEEVTHFLEECQRLDLMVVPLIQTFGHLEFVLKHKKYADLRETTKAQNSICPKNKGSVPLIKKIIDQVLDLHPHIKYFHVGGDEVFNLKTCPVCLADSRNKSQLFLHHMKPVLEYVKSKKLIPLMWDDMMREWSVDDMKELSGLMEPVVWAYGVNLENQFPPDMWIRYSAAFPKIWAASAFKGATKPNSNFVPIDFHVRNNLQWLKIIANIPESSTVEGIALTGWSRFDHYAALCELLPAGLPSLAFCLGTLNKGYMDEKSQLPIKRELGLRDNFEIQVTRFPKRYTPPTAQFPGHQIFTLVFKLKKALYRLTGIEHLEDGWFLSRQIKSNFLSYQHVNTALNYSEQALETLKELKDEVPEPLNEVYDKAVVDEWIEDKIDSNIHRATRRYNELKKMEASFG